MADTDILLSVDLNVADAEKTAEQLQKEVQSIFDSRKGQQSPALTSLESQMKQNYNKAVELKKALESLGDAKIPNKEYQDLETQLNSVESAASKLTRKMKAFEDAGKDTTSNKYQKMERQIEQLGNKAVALVDKLEQMKAAGTDTISGKETDEYKKYEEQLDHINDKLKQQVIKHKQLDGSIEKVNTTTKKININWGKIGATIKRINSTINSMFKGLVNHFRQTEKGAASTNMSFKKLLRTILGYGLGIRGLYELFNRLRSAVKEGLANYVEYSEQYKKKTEDLKAATLTLKNSFATAFAPIIEVAIPYIKQLIDWMSTLLSYVAQFTAAITGQAKYTRAVRQTADALTAAGKAAEGYLSPIDTINKMNKNSGAGGVAGMFEDAEIDSKIADLAAKFKGLIAELLAPLRRAWDTFGDYVKAAWKKVTGSVKNLISDIWRDFKAVWTGSTMQKVFDNMVALLGDILNLVSEIIDKIDEAWNANGRRILEAIAGHLEIITRHFRRFVALTREFINRVDLNPLFEKFAELLEALQPVAEEVFGILEDFYDTVLLNFAEWTLEEGLPKLLQVFKDFAEKVDWEKLRANLQRLWEKLEPFMERVGEGLILFLQDLSDKLANWVNSQSFENLIDKLGKFLDGISAEDVKNGIENFLIFVAAIKALTLIAGLGSTIAKLAELYGTMKQISLLTNLSKTVSVGVEANTAAATAAGTSVASAFAAALLAAIGGFEIGKQLGAIIFPEDKEYYKNFKWFGENGFFQAVADWWDLIFLPYIKKRAEELKTDIGYFNDDVKKLFTTFSDDFQTILVNGLSVIVAFLNGDFSTAWRNIASLVSSCLSTIQNAFNNLLDIQTKLPVIGDAVRNSSIYKRTHGISGGGGGHGFATGGVIPPSAAEHLIKVGDNNTETEIVSPLSVIRQAVSEAMAAMGGGAGKPIVIKQYLDGKQVAQAVVSEGKLQQMSTGRNMFELG